MSKRRFEVGNSGTVDVVVVVVRCELTTLTAVVVKAELPMRVAVVVVGLFAVSVNVFVWTVGCVVVCVVMLWKASVKMTSVVIVVVMVLH